MSEINIVRLNDTPQIRAALSGMLIEVVANRGSVGFMHPLAPEDADGFWEASLSAAAKAKRIILGAFEGKTLVAALTLLLDCPPNQPHRAELAKMMTRKSYRGRGIARALAHEAERLAVARGRTLLVLDTAVINGAAALYERLGYSLTGIIPDYALLPHGGLTGTMIYWKRIGGKG